MKVILLQKVPGIGEIDAVKEVADGYARNFLFPRHLAVQASPKILEELNSRKRRVAKDAENDLREQQSLAQRLDGIEIEIKGKANDKGLLYAAVNEVSVVTALQAKGFAVEKNNIKMKPIKNTGSHHLKLKFRHGLEADLTVTVRGA